MFRDYLAQRDKFDHHVYVMSHLDEDWQLVNPVKIGISGNPKKRLRQVRRDVGRPLVLVATFPFLTREHAYLAEQAFHKACAAYRLDGEWFDMVAADAIGVMEKNIREFVTDFLGFRDAEDLYLSFDQMALPGFMQMAEVETFGYRK